MIGAVVFSFCFASVCVLTQGVSAEWQQLANKSEQFLDSYLRRFSINRVIFYYDGQSNSGHEIRAMAGRFASAGLYVAASPINSSQAELRHNQRATAILISCCDHDAAQFLRMASASAPTSSTSWLLLVADETFRAESRLEIRPDARITLARFSASGTVRVFKWNGAQFATLAANGAVTEPRRTLAGYHFSVAIFHDPPFVNIRSSDDAGNKSVATGWFVQVWNELGNTLHFTTNFYTPSRRRTNTLDKLKVAAEEVSSGRADVVLAPFALTSRAFELAEFSFPVTTLEQRLFMHRSSAVSGVGQFIQPFSNLLWCGVIAVTTFSALLMGAVYTVARRFGFDLRHFDFKESFLVSFSSLLQQGTENSPDATSGRIILWCSYAFGVVIYTAYSAALISKLTVREVVYPFRSLDQMLLALDYQPLVLRDSPVHHLTKEAESGSWRFLRERRPSMKLVDNAYEALDQLMQSKEHLVLLEAHERIGPLIQREPLNCEIMVLPGTVSQPVSFMLQKSSPFKMAIDQEILIMWETGRLARFRDQWLYLMDEDPCPMDSTLPSFDLNNVALPFFVFGFGSVVALLVLFVENCFHFAMKTKHH